MSNALLLRLRDIGHATSALGRTLGPLSSGRSLAVSMYDLTCMYDRTYIVGVDVEWDPSKASSNLRKHGVDFVDAAVALEDEHALTIPDPGSDEEDRFISLCRDPGGKVLVVVFTWRDSIIRIISARGATRREVRRYEEST